MRGWLIYDLPEAQRNRAYIDCYMRSAAACGVALELVLLEKMADDGAGGLLFEGRPAKLPHFAICRRPVPALSEWLESRGVRVFNNARCSRICNDKRLTAHAVAALGVPVAECYYEGPAPGPLPPLPAVVKPVDGHGGMGVSLVSTRAQWQRAVEQLQGRDILVQRPVSDLGRDLRVYVLGGRPVAAMLRRSDTDFRSNYCLGGSAERRELGPEEAEYVARICSAFDFGLVGIDFIYDRGRPVFNEIEDVVGARMLYAKTDMDIADMYLKYIISRMKNEKGEWDHVEDL